MMTLFAIRLLNWLSLIVNVGLDFIIIFTCIIKCLIACLLNFFSLWLGLLIIAVFCIWVDFLNLIIYVMFSFLIMCLYFLM